MTKSFLLSKPSGSLSIVGFAVLALLFMASCSYKSGAAFGAPKNIISIGYQKYSTFSILKARETLDKQLAPLGYTPVWHQFAAGPPLFEALNAGSVDIGHTGETPPIFAQAGNVPFVYLGYESASPKAVAILVPRGSTLRTVADLRGKTIALGKGTSAHYLLVVALAKAGVPYSSVHVVYLAPPDARAAFERGSVDAWVIWDPFYASAQQSSGARVLHDGTGLVAYREFYIGGKDFVARHPDVIKVVLRQLRATDQWAASHKHDVAVLLSPQLGLDVPTLDIVASRRFYGTHPITPDVVAYQQKLADAFYDLKLLPSPVVVKSAVPSVPLLTASKP